MKKISIENMSTIEGGNMCNVHRAMLVTATVSLYVAPFTGGAGLGIGLGLLALATMVSAAYAAGATCG